MHTIQRSILSQFTNVSKARFKDIRPENIPTNLLSYHLASLKRLGYIKQEGKAYQLTPKGLAYVDDLNDSPSAVWQQPQLLTMFVLLNERNEVYLVPRTKQPFVGTWNLLSGKVYKSDISIAAAAQRQLTEGNSLDYVGVARVGEAGIRVLMDGELISSVFVHVFAGRIRTEDISNHNGGRWTSSLDRQQLSLSPAISEIIDTIRSSQHLPFFEEYSFDWQ